MVHLTERFINDCDIPCMADQIWVATTGLCGADWLAGVFQVTDQLVDTLAQTYPFTRIGGLSLIGALTWVGGDVVPRGCA
jgi:acyl-[acyl carrier protein]--UDP-N-acetylglucosamine O-acyltransferase